MVCPTDTTTASLTRAAVFLFVDCSCAHTLVQFVVDRAEGLKHGFAIRPAIQGHRFLVSGYLHDASPEQPPSALQKFA